MAGHLAGHDARYCGATENAMMTTIRTMDDVKALNRENGGHWFAPSTMRFFRSRIGTRIYTGPGWIYFTSSGQRGDWTVRRWSVRQVNPDTGSIETVGDFMSYSSGQKARCAALDLAAGIKGEKRDANK